MRKNRHHLSRRGAIGMAAAAAALLAAPVLGAGSPARIVIVGGGAGGATAARLLGQHSGLQVTLVETNPVYTSCFFSNLYLGGIRDFDSLRHSYDRMGTAGVQVVHDLALGIDRDRKSVALAGGARLPYDRLILSPGIDFVEGSVPGWSLADAQVMPLECPHWVVQFEC